MDLNEYQEQTDKTAIYPRTIDESTSKELGLIYTVLGLNGECGEFTEHVKKAIRDDNGVISPARRVEMIKELGDVFWYIARIAAELGTNLDFVAKTNLDKLKKRYGK